MVGIDMKYRCTLFLIVMLTLNICAQDDNIKSIYIVGRIIDESTQKSINGVHVQVENSQLGTNSLMNGSFNLKISLPKDSFPIQIQFSHISFIQSKISIDYTSHSTLQIKLKPRILRLKEFEVYAGPRMITPNGFSNIIDYEVFGDNIVLLERLNKIRKNKISVIDFSGHILAETIVKGKPISLFKDCTDEVYLIMQDRYLKIFYDTNITLSISDQNLENRIINPCKVLTDSFLIYEEFGYAKSTSWFLKRKFNQSASTIYYFSANRATIRAVKEELLLLHDKFGKTVQDLNLIKIQINNAEQNRKDSINLGSSISEPQYYKPNYCPLFSNNKNIIAFDYGQNLIVLLSHNGETLSKTEIKYCEQHVQKPVILHDKIINDYFALFEKDGWNTLFKIDLNNGTARKFHEIQNIFPEKIKLVNGYLLYLYRYPGTADRYNLYLERY